MHKLFFVFIISVFFLGCGSDSRTSTDDKKQFLSISKAPASSEISITQRLSLEFSSSLREETVSSDSAYINDKNKVKVGLDLEVEVIDENSSKIIFIPHQFLKSSHTYTIVITTDVQNESNQSLSKNYTHQFTTASDDVVDDSNLTMETIKPSDGSVADSKTDISIQFSKFVAPNDDVAITLSKENGEEVNGTTEFFNSIITFKPSAILDYNTTYNIELLGSVTDMFGKDYLGVRNWSFSVGDASTDLAINVGYKSVYKENLDAPSSIIRTMLDSNNKHFLAVAYQNKVEFFDVNTTDAEYPFVSSKYAIDIPSQINAMEALDANNLVVATMSDGLYLLTTSDTGVVVSSHIESSNPIYGVSSGKDIDGVIKKVYAVGPKYGLEIFNIENDNSLTSFVKATVDGTPLKVVEVFDENSVKKIYVSDYYNGVIVFDENATLLSKIKLSGSTKHIADYFNTFEDKTNIFTINTLGISKSIDLDGSVNQQVGIDFLSLVSDISTYNVLVSRLYVSEPENGLVVINSDLAVPQKESLITTEGHIVSSTIFTEKSSTFVATLDQEGAINIFNALSDLDHPSISMLFPADSSRIISSDELGIKFSEYIDPSGLNLVLYDKTTSQTLSYTIESVNTEGVIIYYIVPTAPLSYGHQYTLTIPNDLTDMVGNKFNGGVDQNISYTVNTPPTAVDDINITSVSEDIPLVISASSLLANDSDADGDTFTLASISSSAQTHATVEMDVNGDIAYTPDLNYYGPSSFIYTLIDSYNETDTASITLNVNSINDIPVIDVNTSLTVDEDDTTPIAFSVTDVEDGSITPTLSAQNANVSLSGDFILYTPNSDYFGVDTVTLSVTDSDGSQTVENISVTVNNVNDAPVAVDDNSTARDIPVTVIGYSVPTIVTEGKENQVASLGVDGAYVVVWSGLDDNATNEYSIFTQKFDVNGYKDGNETKLEAIGVVDGNDTTPQVASLGDAGAYVVVWSGLDSDGDYSIYTQKFSADGSFDSSSIRLEAIDDLNNSVTNLSDITPQVASLGDAGVYVVTWSGEKPVDGNFYTIYTQKFKADGSLDGNITLLDVDAYGHDAVPQVAALGVDGAYVVVWSGEESNPDYDYSIFTQKFDINGSLDGNMTKLEAVGVVSNPDITPQVTALGVDGAYAVVWSGLDIMAYYYDVYTQKFDINGSLDGNMTKLEAINNTTGIDTTPQLTALGVNGSYVVTWSGMSSAGDFDIYTQKFDINGSLDGNMTKLEALGYTTGNDITPQITALGVDGKYAVTWSGQELEGEISDYAIYTQKFDVNGSVDGNMTKLEPVNNSFGNDNTPQITALGSDGTYVVTWMGVNENSGTSIYPQKFNSDGTKAERYEGVGTFSLSTDLAAEYYQPTYSTGTLTANGTIYSSDSVIPSADWFDINLTNATGLDYDLTIKGITNLYTYSGIDLNISISDLLVNDMDIDGDTLSVTGVSNAVNASVTINGGVIEFVPDVSFDGLSSFDYTIGDGHGESSTATVEVAVEPLMQ